ncbi:hypothetical protein FD755_008232 [Muntiacus reevesi]|uniref:t-SNARE coiled-coil homology domain-containing protein n=1 Tax=Muntiacus reevesi TaxID=9886 RepID=A0A5J5MNN8_MUNRE|nr:hypothetical protein FD755_008232 [Muntiacus reevesi]
MLRLQIDSFGGLFCFVLLFFLLYLMASWILVHQAGIDPVSSSVEGEPLNHQEIPFLQQLQHSTNQLAKETNELLKELGSLPLPLSTSEQRQQKLQKERLMNDFSAALNSFQAVQRRVSEKEKETIARARAGSRLSAEERQREEQLVSFDSHEEWNQMQRQEDEVAITEQDLELIKERETAIRQLEADILDVNQIFKDLAMMIHDQGDLIDSIEANVESSEVHVERATDQLQRAAYYQKKSRKKICILVLVLTVIIVILGFILWIVNK